MAMPTVPHDLPDDHPISEVGADRTFTIEPVTAGGIAFTRATGNVGGFPLIVTVNDDTKRRHVVRGPQFVFGRLENAKLKIDASAGGGVKGDMWSLTTIPDSQPGEAIRPRVTSEGILQVRGGGERILFDLDTTQDFAQFHEAFRDQATGLFYIGPNKANVFSIYTGQQADAFEAWDLGEYRHAAFYIDQVSLSGSGLNWSCEPFVEVTHSARGRTMDYLSAGTEGQFGNVPPAWSSQVGFIRLGTGATSEDTHTREVAGMFTRLRFGVLVTFNLHDWEAGSTSFPLGFELRLKGLAW
jgi:hypothetical protein